MSPLQLPPADTVLVHSSATISAFTHAHLASQRNPPEHHPADPIPPVPYWDGLTQHKLDLFICSRPRSSSSFIFRASLFIDQNPAFSNVIIDPYFSFSSLTLCGLYSRLTSTLYETRSPHQYLLPALRKHPSTTFRRFPSDTVHVHPCLST